GRAPAKGTTQAGGSGGIRGRLGSCRACRALHTGQSADDVAAARDLRGRRSMKSSLPVVYLARHGQTAWTVSHQHTGVTDMPLTAAGETETVRPGERLAGQTFAGVFTGPLRRATRTCQLAGFGSLAVVEPDLTEWNYGAYEGRTTAEIRAERPGWDLFRDGCPDGETPGQVASRAD